MPPRELIAAGLAADLDWWRVHRDAAGADETALRDLLARLRGWKARHDAERTHQPPPFRCAEPGKLFPKNCRPWTRRVQVRASNE